MRSTAICLVLFAGCLGAARAGPIRDQYKEEALRKAHLKEVGEFIEGLRGVLDGNTDKMAALAAGSKFTEAELDRFVDSLVVTMAISRSQNLRFIQNDLELESSMSQVKAFARSAWKQVAEDWAEAKQEALGKPVETASDRKTLNEFVDKVSELMSDESRRIVGEPLEALN